MLPNLDFRGDYTEKVQTNVLKISLYLFIKNVNLGILYFYMSTIDGCVIFFVEF